MAEKPMSEKQETFIRSLAEDREMDEELKTRLLTTLEVGKVSMASAKAMIRWLLEQPRKAPAQDSVEGRVPEGRYGVVVDGELRVFRVSKPTEGKWAGWVFLRESPDGLIRDRNERLAVLRAIAADVEGAAALAPAKRRRKARA